MRYKTKAPFEQERIHAAAVYCSDGRFGEHFDDFLTNGLQLPRYDRVAVPGGPGCLAGHAGARLEQDGIADELRFLVEAHELDRVILIQHQNCAFYLQRLGIDIQQLREQQIADLAKAADYVRQIIGDVNVEAYLALIGQESVEFEHVELPSPA